MKKQMKLMKIAATLLVAVILVLTLASCGTSSASLEAGDHGVLHYSYESKTLTVTGVGAMESFANADSVVWKAVRTGAEKLVIGEGVTSIGNYAFYAMSALKEVSLPSTLTSVGDYAFAFCGALTSVSMPQGLTAVGKSAFEGCGALASVYLHENVTSIGEKAFASCYSMTGVMITGEDVTVGAQAFKNCRSLETVMFRTSMTAEKIGADAFAGASKTFADATLTDNASGSTTVTVHYVLEDGTAAAGDFVQTWEYGVEYRIPSQAIEGYTADKTMIEGRADGQPRVETVTYKKNEAAADTSAETEAPEPEEEKGVTTGTVIAVVIMVVVLAGIGVGAFLLIRSDKKNAGKNTTTVRKKPEEKNAKGGKKNQKKGK